MKPYIGVSSLTHPSQIITALKVVPQNAKHKLMAGTSVSFKSLRRLPLSPRWEKRMINPDLLNRMMLDDERLLNLVHYSADNGDALNKDLESIHRLAGPNLSGFQLNIVWPNIEQLTQYRIKYPSSHIVLNLFPPTLKSVDYNAKKLDKRLAPYLDLVDAVLIDGSGGQGQSLDPKVTSEILERLSRHLNLGLGIAGRLGPFSLDPLLQFSKYFPTLSIDAETEIRDSITNEIDHIRMVVYIELAYYVLEKPNLTI